MTLRRRTQGFSMLELSVVIGIIALIVGAGISMGGNAIATAKRIQTRERLETIKYALEAYGKANGYLPCPSNRTFVTSTANFGTSVYPCVAASPGIKSVGAGAAQKFIGAVPVRSLGLPDNYSADAWGNKFNYTVMAQLTSNLKSTTALGMPVYIVPQSTTAADDNTSITDRATVPSTPGAITQGSGAGWAVVSYGPDAEGAFPYQGTAVGIACASGADQDFRYNCREDGSGFRDLKWNESKYNYGSRYDDMMVWGSHENERIPITTTQPPTCSSGCEAWCAPCTNDLHSGAPANMDANSRNLCRKFITLTSPCQATCLWSGTLTAGPRRVMCP